MCGLKAALQDPRDIDVHGCSDEELMDKGISPEEFVMHRDLWAILLGAVRHHTTKLMLHGIGGPSAGWREREKTFAPLTGGEQSSLLGKFYNAKQGSREDPRAYYQHFMTTVASLESALNQPIPKMIVLYRFIEGLTDDYEIQKQQLLCQRNLEVEDMLMVLRARAGYLNKEEGQRKPRGAESALLANGGGAKRNRKQKKKPGDGGASTTNNRDISCFVCGGNHYATDCSRQWCQRCGKRGHHVSKCREKPEESTSLAMVLAPGETSDDQEF